MPSEAANVSLVSIVACVCECVYVHVYASLETLVVTDIELLTVCRTPLVQGLSRPRLFSLRAYSDKAKGDGPGILLLGMRRILTHNNAHHYTPTLH